MAPSRLDYKLLKKLSKRIGKSEQYLREQLSKRAHRKGSSSEVELILWCREQGLGVATYLRKQPSYIQDQVRGTVITADAQRTLVRSAPKTRKGTPHQNQRVALQAVINYLIRDHDLRSRCQDLLKASAHFDRVIREATTIFDDRLKKLTGIEHMDPSDLVGKALSPDPQRAVIVVSTKKSEQEGFHSICKGLILTFRNFSHHKLSEKNSREDALKFCGFVDTILALLGQGSIHLERI